MESEMLPTAKTTRLYCISKVWILMALGTTGVQVLMTLVGTILSSIAKGKGHTVCRENYM